MTFEDYVKSVFKETYAESERHRGFFGGFGRGFDMHDAALKVAPEWLRNWGKDNNWAIFLTMNWDGFLSYAEAFGWSKKRVLDSFEYYAGVTGEWV